MEGSCSKGNVLNRCKGTLREEEYGFARIVGMRHLLSGDFNHNCWIDRYHHTYLFDQLTTAYYNGGIFAILRVVVIVK